MRSTFSGLNTMVRGVFANQLSLDTVGHNITNASTEGYSRQKVNLAATRGQGVSSLYGNVMVGTGVDSMSIERARNIYADKQFWQETSTQEYYKTTQVNYEKIEAVFDDSDKTGIMNAMDQFYAAWQNLSKDASTASTRVAVIEKGNTLADRIKTAGQQLQSQINSQYDDMRVTVNKVNETTAKIVQLNKNIMQQEAIGASANDLRDQRDLLVDELSQYMNLNVYEDEKGMYSVVSNGITMVGGVERLTLEMSDPINNGDYGINDYVINIKESGITFLPQNGSLKAQQDTIAEDKEYIDKLADMAGFLLTTFNNMHQQGAGINGSDSSLGSFTTQPDGTVTDANGEYKGPLYGLNFYGDDNTVYEWDADNHQMKATAMTAGTVTRSLDGYTETTNADGTTTRMPKVKIDGTIKSVDTVRGINIITALTVNGQLSKTGGQDSVAARIFSVEQATDANGKLLDSYKIVTNGSKDGTNAVNLSALINMNGSEAQKYNTAKVYLKDSTEAVSTSSRSTEADSLNAYYNAAMSRLGSDAESLKDKESSQEDLITQIVNWRSSTAGVDWNEELTNMITFQKGYSACSRCLTTMDEMLDRLINSTGTVGR
ncbi:flagellar hook-associated protein FlgK [Selenomonas ruminis]|uniref:Flagellar hook-associated protein 1 n=1 Tax=Selenomonas ruminis TaxID=2593411 RepID=A0A5D6VW80_9FIRM|nr:flagellar hook-associated protein FlgK [Selenomonas sp. mPRGC5]TYZ20321.1 flagellar hook-associated protein FlgK [Selenomonas sp. mPRGC5]